MGGGAWPFLVRGVNCLVNSVNDRGSSLLNSSPVAAAGRRQLLRGKQGVAKPTEIEQ